MCIEANIMIIKCPDSGKTVGVRLEKMNDGDWWRTWAFKISDQQVKYEGYDKTQIQGNLYYTDEYPGCPYCGTKNLVKCGHCGKFLCWHGNEGVKCPWCGTEIKDVVTATDKFDITGNQF